jgi:hypothetical protein
MIGNPDFEGKQSASKPRSAQEVLEFSRQPREEKYKQLPCITFISNGSCPYNNRCRFLHDQRLTAKVNYHKRLTTAKNKEHGKYTHKPKPSYPNKQTNKHLIPPPP